MADCAITAFVVCSLGNISDRVTRVILFKISKLSFAPETSSMLMRNHARPKTLKGGMNDGRPREHG